MTARRPTRRGVLRGAAALAAAGSLGGTAIARTDNRKEFAGASHRGIDAVLRAATAGAKDLPGVVALAANDQEIIYEGIYGTRRLSSGSAMTRDTVFRIASMVKTITSVAAMQLVEQGKLALDARTAGEAADHAPPPADAHVGLRLSAVGRRGCALHGGPQTQHASYPADVRPG
jgi:CubicO group peptidase (beta-lactamase class C family)